MLEFRSVTRRVPVFAIAAVAAFVMPVWGQQNTIRNVSVSAGSDSGKAQNSSRVIVHFRSGTTFLPGSGKSHALGNGVHVVDNPPGVSVADAIQRYKQNPNVTYAEPDYIVKTTATPTDPMWSQQWDMTKISAPTAWNTVTNTSDVIVAVIDTGVDYTHPDLQGNLWTNSADGSHGYTCMNGVCSAGGQDDFGHGTHVAGTIGAVANNGAGIAGLNWRTQILSCKFLDSTGAGNISDAVLCFNQIATLKQQGYNIRVTNNSWGGGGFSQALKDAMSAVEAAGIVNVCAAGNSGVDADVSPMYPGAYDNRGIISVLATDSSDLGASFTNYGIGSVDIAAPGVNTLSTVPAGSCPLCDPSGYKLLSGTSMATPHVTGVMAAIFHLNPALTASQARDVLLDPASYDAMTDARSKASSTGGRLNYSKAILNPLLMAPKTNNFPVLTMPPDVTVSGGSTVSITPSATDADNDPLTGAWTKPSSYGLLGTMIDTLFPTPTGNSVSFTAPKLARSAIAHYYYSVADGRGGSAVGVANATVSAVSNPSGAPTGSVSVSSTAPPANSSITVNFPVTDPGGLPTVWSLWVSSGTSVMNWCCMSGSSVGVNVGSAGVYRVGAQAMNKQLSSSARSSVSVKVGGATGEPPVANAVLDKLSGSVPLTVTVDMSSSYDPDGTIQGYYVNCGGGTVAAGPTAASQTCTFTTPGSYWLWAQVQDNAGNPDTMDLFVVATPASGGTPSPLTSAITSPTSGATVSGTVSVSANASGGAGIQKVDFYRDAGVLLGTSTASPYSVSWNTSGLSSGSHSLYAVATDLSGATATSASVSVSVSSPFSVTMNTPVSNALVSGNVSVGATVNGGTNVQKVVFYRDSSVLIGTATASPYSISWSTSGVSTGNHTLYAVASDSTGATATSSPITVNVTAPLTVSIGSPSSGATVSGTITVSASASGGAGVQKVDVYRDSGVLLGTATVSPYGVSWNTGSVSAGSHTLYAVVTDVAGATATSASVSVTVSSALTVSISNPTANAVVAGTISVGASVSGGNAVQRVDFYRDSAVLLGTSTVAPYSYLWNTATVTAGSSHNLYAVVTDSTGNATSVPVTVVVDPPPAVSISVQPSSTTVSRKSNVTVTANVTVGGYPVSRVDFSVNSTVVCSDSTSPYTCTWQVPASIGKTYQIKATVYDTKGQTGSSDVITVTAQ